MRLSIYGRYILECLHSAEGWRVYRLSNEGKRRRVQDIVIPDTVGPEDLVGFLDDLLHEVAAPGRVIQILD